MNCPTCGLEAENRELKERLEAHRAAMQDALTDFHLANFGADEECPPTALCAKLERVLSAGEPKEAK